MQVKSAKHSYVKTLLKVLFTLGFGLFRVPPSHCILKLRRTVCVRNDILLWLSTLQIQLYTMYTCWIQMPLRSSRKYVIMLLTMVKCFLYVFHRCTERRKHGVQLVLRFIVYVRMSPKYHCSSLETITIPVLAKALEEEGIHSISVDYFEWIYSKKYDQFV